MSKPTTPIPFARPGAPVVGCDQAPELQLNLNVRGLTPSATVAINELSDRLRLRGIHTSVDLCARLLEETGVAILPGSEFGRPVTELTARLAYVNFDGAAALRAVARLEPGERIDERFLRRHCGEVLEAAERIRDWLNA
jgi:hypothetical protein